MIVKRALENGFFLMDNTMKVNLRAIFHMEKVFFTPKMMQ
jgi:hypothetical protein